MDTKGEVSMLSVWIICGAIAVYLKWPSTKKELNSSYSDSTFEALILIGIFFSGPIGLIILLGGMGLNKLGKFLEEKAKSS